MLQREESAKQRRCFTTAALKWLRCRVDCLDRLFFSAPKLTSILQDGCIKTVDRDGKISRRTDAIHLFSITSVCHQSQLSWGDDGATPWTPQRIVQGPHRETVDTLSPLFTASCSKWTFGPCYQPGTGISRDIIKGWESLVFKELFRETSEVGDTNYRWENH